MLLRYDYILTSYLSDKTDLISNFRIADLPGITDTNIPGNPATKAIAKSTNPN